VLLPQAGGTAYCEELRECMDQVSVPALRVDKDIVKRCLRESTRSVA
jgi:hypothetical protein